MIKPTKSQTNKTKNNKKYKNTKTKKSKSGIILDITLIYDNYI